jgi:hypothetical protein
MNRNLMSESHSDLRICAIVGERRQGRRDFRKYRRRPAGLKRSRAAESLA